MDLPAWIFVFLPVVLDRLVEMWRLGFLGSINKYNSFGMHIGKEYDKGTYFQSYYYNLS